MRDVLANPLIQQWRITAAADWQDRPAAFLSPPVAGIDKAPAVHTIALERDDQALVHLSQEGLSFVVSANPFNTYKRGMRIDGLTLLFERKKITTNAVVLNARALPPSSREKGVRVGIKFSDMAAKDSELLGDFVEREIQMEIAKKLR